MLAKEILEEFRLACELRRLSPRTIKGYFNSTTLFLNYLEKQLNTKELEAIRLQHIKLYVQDLMKRNLKLSYINFAQIYLRNGSLFPGFRIMKISTLERKQWIALSKNWLQYCTIKCPTVSICVSGIQIVKEGIIAILYKI